MPSVSFSSKTRIFLAIIAVFVAGNTFAQLNIPYEQTFATSGFPAGWTVQYTGITATIWKIDYSGSAGGTTCAANASTAYQTGISRLVTPAFITSGMSQLRLTFRQKLVSYDRPLCIKVQSSSDGINWTDEEFVYNTLQGSIAAEYKSIMIRHNLGVNTWLAFVVDGYHNNYIGWSVDDIYVGEFTAQANCPWGHNPSYNQTNVPLIGALTWKTGLYSMGHTLFMGTDNQITNMVNGLDLGLNTSYNYPPLLPNTQYRYKVLTYNNNGVKPYCSNQVFTTTPALPLPFADSFNNTSIDAAWAQQSILEEGNPLFLWTIGFQHKTGGTTYEAKIEENSARGISRLITPPLNTTGLTELSLGFNQKIEFLQAGVSFKIQSSADGANWTDEKVWPATSANIGPEPFFINIHNNLGNYTFISFTLEGDFSVIDGWYIDNVMITGISGVPGCITQMSPPDSATNIAPGIDLRWSPVAIADGYKLYLGTDNPPTNFYDGLDVGNIHKINFTTLSPTQTYYWKVVPYNQNGDASGCPVKVFYTIPAQTIPYLQNFNSPAMPSGWLAQWTGHVDSTIWDITPLSGPYGPYCLIAEGEYRDDRGISRMIMPPLNTDTAFNLLLSFRFMFFSNDTNLRIKIQSSQDARNWTDENWSLSSETNENLLTMQRAQVLIPAHLGNSTFIAFAVESNHTGLQQWYIDSVSVQGVYTIPSCISTPSPPQGSTAIGLNSTLTWNKNILAMGYRLYLGTDNPPTNILNGLNLGPDTTWHEVVFSSSTQYYWKIVPYNNAGEAIFCPVWNFTTTSLQSLPFSESFNSTIFPAYWTLEHFGKEKIWFLETWGPSTNLHGDMHAYPINSSYFFSQGTSRMVSPPINTTGLSMLTLRFRHSFTDMDNGVYLRIQTSTDGLHWSNENWYHRGGDGDIDDDTLVLSLGQNLGSITFISFTIEGGLAAFAEWVIDDVVINAGTGSPVCPNLVYPPPGLVGAAELQQLKWEIRPTATTYLLNIGTDNPPSNLVNNFSTGPVNEYTTDPLQQGTQYYWQVIPQNPLGTATGCPVQFFTVTVNKYLPYTDNFDESYFPAGWRQEHGGGVMQNIWSLADTNFAGGQSPELKTVGFNANGTTRLISPPLNTSNCEYITLSFKHLYHPNYYDAEMYLQSSADGINWTNEMMLFQGGYSMNSPAPISAKIIHNLGAKTYLALMVAGNHVAIQSWQIDNINIVPTYNERPEIFTISAPDYVCQGTSNATVSLSGSQLNAVYKFYKNTSQAGPDVNGTGLPLNWPGQTSGTYHIIAQLNGKYVMMAGGKSIFTAALPNADAGPDVSISQGQSVQLECNVSAGTLPFNYTWSPAAGLSNPAISNPFASPSVTTSYIVSVSDAWSCGDSDTIVVTVNPAGNSINGSLVYDNSSLSYLTNCQVELIKDGISIQSTTTDSNGNFTFNDLEPGDYTFSININKPWGGGNAVDALQIMQHFVSLIQLTGLPLQAADIISLGAINSIDALNVMRRFVGLITSFITGDWIVENPTVNVANNSVSIQIKALCYGDVNRSYIPPQ